MASPRIPPTIALGTFVAGDDSSLHALVRSFRAGDPEAYRTALGAATRALAAWTATLATDGIIVAVPAHAPGGPVRPLDRLVAELAASIGLVAPAEPPLRRVRAVPEAKLQRADPTEAAASLRWTSPASTGAVILVDDVIRSGGTIDACVDAIRSTSPSAGQILVLGLARAIEPDDDPRAAAGR